MRNQTHAFFTNRTTDGSSDAIAWSGGELTIQVEGTPDTAQIDIEAKLPGASSFVAIGGDATFTAAGIARIAIDACELRATQSSSGGSTDLSVLASWRTAVR